MMYFSPSNKIKCGIIGYGKMGKIRHKAISLSNLAEVVMVYDIEADIPLPLKVESIDEIINSKNIDAIFICTPNNLISALCIKALDKNKHVFAEKPPGVSFNEVKEVMEFSNTKPNLRLMYGFNHRHHDSIKKIKEIIDSKALGEVLWVRGRYGKEVEKSYFDGWRANIKKSGAGILIDQGIHIVDLLLYLVGNFDEIHSLISNDFWKIDGLEDNVFSILRNNSTRISASIHSTMTQWRYIFSLEIFLEGGSLILNGLKTSSGAYGDEVLSIKTNKTHNINGSFDTEENISYELDNSWNSEIEHFFNAINDGTNIEIGSPKDAIEIMDLLERIYKADKSWNMQTL